MYLPQARGAFFLFKKAASKITVVHHALKLAAAVPGKRMLLYVDDLFKPSMVSLLYWLRLLKRLQMLTAGLSPTEYL